jgi:Flp pilus assembly protein TadG
MNHRRRRQTRKGNVVVLAAFLMVGMMGFLAFAIDLGVVCVARDELQRTADASAIAATWELIDEEALSGYGNPLLTSNARARADEYAAMNAVLMSYPQLADDDVQVGYLADPTDPNGQMDTTGLYPPNAVRVTVRRTATQNGTVPLLFGRAMGMAETSVSANATAAMYTSFKGFQTPSNGSNLGILPFALDWQSWNDLVENNVGTDNWTWDADDGVVRSGPDGIKECNLYPQGTGSPGNRGTVDIGSSNNSTADIARQIKDGVSPADLNYHGGKLELDESGQLTLNGDTGISAGIKDELASVMGEPRIIPVFTQVQGPGNNAMYTITMFAGVRIMEVQLTGKNTSKKVLIQPATVVTLGGIPGSSSGTSDFVYSPVRLIR